MFGWFQKKSPPSAPKRCAECAAEMDANETVCPKCGHGIQEQRERKDKAKAETKPPGVDMSDLTKEWPGMSTAARRRAMRARILGTDRTFFARIGKWLGLTSRHTPPSAQRVAARAMALAAIIWRGYLEMNLKDHPPESWQPQRDHVFGWLKGLGIAGELEPDERDF